MRVIARLFRHSLQAVLVAALAAACAKKETTAEEAPSSGDRVPLTAASGAGLPRDASASAGRHAAFSERVAERHAFVQRTIAERDVQDPRVIRAMRTVPRHAFVSEGTRDVAYTDRPLPIVGAQTISQPYIVAFMSEAAKPTAESKCLEIGTGSGYQAAVLAELCAKTYSIEYLPEVAEFGKENLRRLGYGSDVVSLRVGDGYRGWPEAAPFDVIIVTAAPDHVPRPLLDQLAVGGRLVIPVGPEDGAQELERWTRVKAGKGDNAFHRERLIGVRFVPFLGEGASRK